MPVSSTSDWYSDAEAAVFADFLEAKYRAMGRPTVETAVDPIGRVVWPITYADQRARGLGTVEARRAINARINQILGLPEDTWPEGWRPTDLPIHRPDGRPPVDRRRIRSVFSLGRGHFDHFSAADYWIDRDVWRRTMAAHVERGDTHVLVGLQSNGYATLAPFDYFREPERVIEAVVAMRDEFGLVAQWVLHDDTARNRAVGQRANHYRARWGGVAEAIRPYVDVVIPAYEWNDHLTPKEQHTLLHELARLFPDAYRLVTFTDNRWALTLDTEHREPEDRWRGDPVWGLPGDLEEYPWWRAMAGVVHGLAFQAPWELINDHSQLRARLAAVVLRLNGTRQPEFPAEERDFDQKFGGHPAGAFDVHAWELGAEWVIRGDRPLAWTEAAGRAALTVPGVIGAGDGWR